MSWIARARLVAALGAIVASAACASSSGGPTPKPFPTPTARRGGVLPPGDPAGRRAGRDPSRGRHLVTARRSIRTADGTGGGHQGARPGGHSLPTRGKRSLGLRLQRPDGVRVQGAGRQDAPHRRRAVRRRAQGRSRRGAEPATCCSSRRAAAAPATWRLPWVTARSCTRRTPGAACAWKPSAAATGPRACSAPAASSASTPGHPGPIGGPIGV